MRAQDQFTRQYLSEHFGQRTNIYRTETQQVFRAAGSRRARDIDEAWQMRIGQASIAEQRVTEPLIYPHELGALDRDEAIIGYAGRVYRSLLPQPQDLPGIREPLAEAERAMKGE